MYYQNLSKFFKVIFMNSQFVHYAVITPEQANLPLDVLEAIPYEGMQNSKTGGAPKNLWQQLSVAIGGAITSVADFIYNGLVALGNFIEHAAEVVAQFAMKLWSTGVALGIESVALGVIGLRNTEINGNVVLSLIGMGLSAVSIIMFLTLR